MHNDRDRYFVLRRMWVLGALAIVGSNSVTAGEVFRCESGGKVTYSDIACPQGADRVAASGLNSFTADEPVRQIVSKHPARQSVPALRDSRSASIAEEQAKHKQHCRDLTDRIDAITTKLWSDSSLRKRSNRTEQLQERQRKLAAERSTAKCR